MKAWIAAIISLSVILGSTAQQCGWQADGALCPDGLCCSRFGWCGATDEYCEQDCQSQCGGGRRPGPPSGVASIISAYQFNQMLHHRDDYSCPARGFYTYDAFITAANSFDGFGTTGSIDTRKREIAAFLGQTSHETTGGGPAAPGGPYSWGYCLKEEQGHPSDYCSFSLRWPCKPGKKYYGRGPMQLSYNYNYGPAGRAIGEDLLADPDLVAWDPIVSFKTAIWYWMTPQFLQKPSCHDVITGHWFPLPTDIVAGRYSGYGTITNIINGGSECGRGEDDRVNDRIGFYKRYCDILRVDPGQHLDCNHQLPFQPKLLPAISV
uniref:chitinase n=1 Tax=Allium sativum TaxID=4682 RepID=A0A8E7DAH4_ALLSA|nr:chitinase [Allium sativum]